MAQSVTGGVRCPWKQGLGFSCRGGGMPRPPAFDVRTAEIDVKTAGTEKSLPLGEGGFAKQRRMRGGRGYQCSTGQSLPLGVVPRAANPKSI